MTARFDAVMLIAFGGPQNMDEVRPFLERVLAGRPVPPARFDEVVHHYEVIGGRSPLVEITRRQAAALEQSLAQTGPALPVVLGMRNSAPYLRDTLRALHERGSRRVLGVIMAAHESPASHGRYRVSTQAALEELGPAAPMLTYSASFHGHPGFVTANVEHLRAAILRLPPAEREDALLVFTAHSIPVSAAEGSPYVAQLQHNAAQVAAALGRTVYRIAYQSRSGSPRDPWLEPDINDLLRSEAARGVRAVVVCPIGFVCDHVEVLYDLDVEASATARALGLELTRGAAPNDHPAFIAALADGVREASHAAD
jgi:ferrochelatase